MAAPSELRHAGSVIRYDSGILEPMEPRLFDVGWLRAQGHHRGASSGRGEAHFLSFAGCEMVLRPFRRGGLMGKINRDLYLWSGLEQSRSLREFALLRWMRDQGLPVPRPVAARITRFGLVYRAALLTERILGARPLEEVLRESALPEGLWPRVGTTVRRMHDAGVDHSDLNARNILIDPAEKVWLIDFDKCARRAPGAWTGRNLDRLQRSLRKLHATGGGLHWAEPDWAALLAGYASPMEAR